MRRRLSYCAPVDAPHVTPAEADALALVVVDVQRGFDDAEYWGPRNNPGCERNISALLAAWRTRGRPVVFVRHDSTDSGSPLRPGQPGNEFKSVIDGEPDLLVTKSVNSCFHGTPDLDAWLRGHDLAGCVIAGITTNHCCETTARLGGNLGYRVLFALDATHTFDRRAPSGEVFTADQLCQVTAANLDGEFATVVSTQQLLPSDARIGGGR
jgi:nicotinamidase-related amidase